MLQLTKIRKENGISRSNLSKISNIPLRTLEDIERRGDCRVSTLYQIAKALNVSLDDLYGEDD